MTHLIKTADAGIYKGFSKDVTIASKFIIGGLVIWAVAFPEQAGSVLNKFNSFILRNFVSCYIRVLPGDGNPDSVEAKLANWQGAWPVSYWAWRVAFAPVVGWRLTRSRGAQPQVACVSEIRHPRSATLHNRNDELPRSTKC